LEFRRIAGIIGYDDEQSSGMRESQIDRIRRAEEAAQELIKNAAQFRQDADILAIDDPNLRTELLQMAEGLEAQAQKLRDSLREWREDIH
jgi:phage/plasmid primase-like uncharacterized protein